MEILDIFDYIVFRNFCVFQNNSQIYGSRRKMIEEKSKIYAKLFEKIKNV